MSKRAEKAKAAIQRNKAANEAAANEHEANKDALVVKVNQKGGAGKLTRAELKLAKQMAEGEGKNNNP